MESSSQLGIKPQVGTTVSWMKTLGPKTVLCVDDEAIGLRVRKIMLESHGFNVLTANSGQQGLTVFDDNTVDLVVLDYYMPGMNGGDVAAEIAQAPPCGSHHLSVGILLPAAGSAGTGQCLHHQGRPARRPDRKNRTTGIAVSRDHVLLGIFRLPWAGPAFSCQVNGNLWGSR